MYIRYVFIPFHINRSLQMSHIRSLKGLFRAMCRCTGALFKPDDEPPRGATPGGGGRVTYIC